MHTSATTNATTATAHAASGGSAQPAGPTVLQRLMGDDVASWMPAGIAPFALMRVRQDATLTVEGAPARCVYLVQGGQFKTVRTDEDGYEQVQDFADRHDLLGCDALADGRYASSAVALEESWVYALPTSDLQGLVRQSPAFAARWQAAMARQILRAGDRAWLMGAVGAEKRVARFVLLAARRQAERGEPAHRVRLHMGRRDVASHLGLAHESVSRSLTVLSAAGMLAVHNRDITLTDPAALRAFASSTRGYPDLRRQQTRGGGHRSDGSTASAATPA